MSDNTIFNLKASKSVETLAIPSNFMVSGSFLKDSTAALGAATTRWSQLVLECFDLGFSESHGSW